jgi:hypothetical protein
MEGVLLLQSAICCKRRRVGRTSDQFHAPRIGRLNYERRRTSQKASNLPTGDGVCNVHLGRARLNSGPLLSGLAGHEAHIGGRLAGSPPRRGPAPNPCCRARACAVARAGRPAIGRRCGADRRRRNGFGEDLPPIPPRSLRSRTWGPAILAKRGLSGSCSTALRGLSATAATVVAG